MLNKQYKDAQDMSSCAQVQWGEDMITAHVHTVKLMATQTKYQESTQEYHFDRLNKSA